MKGQEPGSLDEIPVTLGELREAVGIYFSAWSMLERSLSSVLIEFGASEQNSQRQSISRKLNLWKQLHIDRTPERDTHHQFIAEIHSLLQNSLEVRNLLAHGITGFSALIPGRSQKASISTELNDKQRTIEYGELQRITAQTGTIASHMDRITSYALEPNKCRHSDLHAEIREMLDRPQN